MLFEVSGGFEGKLPNPPCGDVQLTALQTTYKLTFFPRCPLGVEVVDRRLSKSGGGRLATVDLDQVGPINSNGMIKARYGAGS